MRSQQRVANTLQFRRGNGRLLILTIIILGLFSVAAEALVRAIEPYAILGTPSIGSNYTEFEVRLNEFETYTAERKSVDCVFLGDSTTMTNFAPYVFAEAFQEQTGKNIECFNFGAGAFTTADSAALAQIVVQEHTPTLLILGIEALNLTIPSDIPGDVDLTELAWTQYKLGQFTIEGWLYEHAVLFRHMDAIRRLITLKTSPTEMRRITAETNNSLRDGFYPMDEPNRFDVSQLPDPHSDHPYHDNYFSSLTNYQLLPEQLAALDQVVALNSPTTQIVLVEMPVPPTFYNYFGNGEQDYDRFIEAVEQSVSGTTVPFWRTADLALFPDSLWFNYNHLNVVGAPIFSQWLGQQLGQAVIKGTVGFVVEEEETNGKQ